MVSDRLGREPNALEAAVFGALWSEHCGYKNSRPLLKRLPTKGPQVLQGPGENAGVVDIGDGWAVAFKMESHNHPSAVEPFQGAATGVGGILRDIFAMGARPIAVLDSLRFGELDVERNRYLLAGVVSGIAHYGNAIGVPTVGGEIETNPCYQENPLVNVMALGLLRHDQLRKGTVGAVGNRLFYVGSKTGRDGLGGAVFASADLSDTSDADRPAVQVGDPFMEKLLLEACLEAIALDLVAGVQDMGAAGISSSVGEMAHRAGLGVDLHIDRVPRREHGMSAMEVMLSESQERMVLTAIPGKEAELVALFERWGLDVSEIGTVADHGLFKVIENGVVRGAMPVAALNEPPSYERVGVERQAIIASRERDLGALPVPDDMGIVLQRLLAAASIADKLPVYRQYDHQVMTNTVVLPGRADAAVLRVKGSDLGIAATVDCNARYVYLEPRLGAAHAVAEAARNLSCVGARPLGVTDNLNFGNPTDLGVYYQMEQAVAGISEACLALGTPVTGGNVSLYNQFTAPGENGPVTEAVHPTPTIGMVGVLEDISRHATSDLKEAGLTLLLLGGGEPSIAASEYLYRVHGLEAGSPPELDLVAEAALHEAVRELVANGSCNTAHDVSNGGLAVCLAEMAIGGGLGMQVEVPAFGSGSTAVATALFGESAGRIVIAVSEDSTAEVEATCRRHQVPVTWLGSVGGERLEMSVVGNGAHGAGTTSAAIDVALAELAAAHQLTFTEALG